MTDGLQGFDQPIVLYEIEEGADRIRSLQRKHLPGKVGLEEQMQTSLQGIAKKSDTNLSFTEASISEEPSAVVPHAGICAGQSGNWLSYRDNL